MVDTGVAGAAGLDAGLGEDLARAALALARRFAAGATMWCLAPAWPEHARHVAVEFVHPVIMGKRALPAVSVVDPDPVGALRATVRRRRAGRHQPGRRRGRAVGDAPRRWRGAPRRCGSVRLRPRRGGGPRAVDRRRHRRAAHDGRLVLLYHVLWELTHVCFEHRALAPGEESCELGTACVTCSTRVCWRRS
jgi:hypothetical protein